MIRILFLFVFIFTFSCKPETEKTKSPSQNVKVIKRFNYCITVDVWNGFFRHESKFILNNSLINSYDATDTKIPLAKPLTFYYISFKPGQGGKNQNVQTLAPGDTTEVPFSIDLSDTLFILTNDFLKSVEFNNYDTVGQLIPFIRDDSHAMVELSYCGRKLMATINSINNPTISTKQLDTLLNFIDKFRPAKVP